MAETAYSLLYVTAGDANAAKALGRALVEARLAACANVLPAMTSVYRWQGALEEAREAVLIVKTRSELVERATAFLLERHDYDCPCVVALPLIGGNPAFLAWIGEETASQPSAG